MILAPRLVTISGHWGRTSCDGFLKLENLFFEDHVLRHRHCELGQSHRVRFLTRQLAFCCRRAEQASSREGRDDAEGYGSGESHQERGRGCGGSSASAQRLQQLAALGRLRSGLHSVAFLVVRDDAYFVEFAKLRTMLFSFLYWNVQIQRPQQSYVKKLKSVLFVA